MNCFQAEGASSGLGPGRGKSEDWQRTWTGRRNSTAVTTTIHRRLRQKLACAPGFFFDGPAFDEFTADMITEAGCIGNANGALRRNFNFRFDDVFGPVAFAGGNVARQGIAGEGSNGDVVGAADAGFEHAPAPNGNIFCEAVTLACACTGMAANAAEFYVDDARGAEFDGCGRIANVLDGFIEAERSLQEFLQFGMCVDVVPPERLLHHEQAKLVEAFEVINVVESIGGVCVYGERCARKSFANRADILKIFSGLDFQLDALIAGIDFHRDFFAQDFV